MNRVYNFSAGPSVLPLEVLEKAASEMTCYGKSGMSVMEMSHRSKDYEEIINRTESLLRKLMKIPEQYKVLFLQGGASSQFAMIPMNLMTKNKKADIVVTGQWAKKALSEGEKYGTMNVVASSADKTFTYIPELDSSTFSKDADYFYITTNNTIYGTRYTTLPETGDIPLVADMSSNILSQEYDIHKFGLVFAGAQKNMGPAGLCVVIVKEELLSETLPGTPTMFDYKIHIKNGSMYNTPPTYPIYICGLVLEWLDKMGGIGVMEKINIEKAQRVYDFLDNSNLFKGTVVPKDRSLMNIPFVTGSEELDAKFVKEAKENGLTNLKGHRTVGGMRASIYNAMPMEGVDALIDFMKKFEMENK